MFNNVTMKKFSIIKKFGLMLAVVLCFSVLAAFAQSVFAQESAGTVNSYSMNQTYTVIDEAVYHDTFEVKVEWNVQDIGNHTENKIWNESTLSWDIDESASLTMDADEDCAVTEIHITNLSTRPVEAKISFAEDQKNMPEAVMVKTVGDDQSNIAEDEWFTIGSVVNSDYSVDLNNIHAADITIASTQDNGVLQSTREACGSFILSFRYL